MGDSGFQLDRKVGGLVKLTGFQLKDSPRSNTTICDPHHMTFYCTSLCCPDPFSASLAGAITKVLSFNLELDSERKKVKVEMQSLDWGGITAAMKGQVTRQLSKEKEKSGADTFTKNLDLVSCSSPPPPLR